MALDTFRCSSCIVVIMTTINVSNSGGLDGKALERALQSLAVRLNENDSGPYEIVICGGSALILSGLLTRTTKDVDVVALASCGAPKPSAKARLCGTC